MSGISRGSRVPGWAIGLLALILVVWGVPALTAAPAPGSPPSKFSHLRSTDGGRTFAPRQLADASDEAEQTRAVAEAGTVHALYDDRDPSPRRVFYRRSTDGGRTFGSSLRLDRPEGAAAVEVADSGEADIADGGTVVGVAWEDDRLLTEDLTLPDPVRLRSDVLLSDGTVLDRETGGAADEIDGNNTILPRGFVIPAGSVDPRSDQAYFKPGVMTVGREDRQVNRDEIFFTASTDDGRSFAAPVNLTRTAGIHERDPDVAAQGRRLVVVYEGGDETSGAETSDDDVFVAVSSDGGRSWDRRGVNLTATPGIDDEPAVAVEGDDITVAFRRRDIRGGPGVVQFVHSGDGGTTFSAPRRLPGSDRVDGLGQTSPAVAAAGEKVHVLTCENRDPDGESGTGDERFALVQWTSTDRGATFTDDGRAQIDRGDGECDRPALAATGGTAHVVYERDVLGAADVLYLRSVRDARDGAHFGPARNLSHDQAGSSDPTISVDPGHPGSVHVTWSNETDFLFALAQGQDLPGEDGREDTYASEDVIRFTGGVYEMVLDGSDVGLDDLPIDGLSRLSRRELLLSFSEPGTVPGVGPVAPADIVRFTATRLGERTAGTFSAWFDGSDVGLSDQGEQGDNIDAVEFWDGDLFLSTAGPFSLRAASGEVKGDDEDVFVCRGVVSGPDTACASAVLAFDGSAVGLGDASEDVDAFAFGGGGAGPTVNEEGQTERAETDALFSFADRWAVPGAAGGESDLARCVFPESDPGAGEPPPDLADCGGADVPLWAVFSARAHQLRFDVTALELDY